MPDTRTRKKAAAASSAEGAQDQNNNTKAQKAKGNKNLNDDGKTEYEILRDKNIAARDAFLREIGLHQTVEQLASSSQSVLARPKARPRARLLPATAAQPLEATRRSSRISANAQQIQHLSLSDHEDAKSEGSDDSDGESAPKKKVKRPQPASLVGGRYAEQVRERPPGQLNAHEYHEGPVTKTEPETSSPAELAKWNHTITTNEDEPHQSDVWTADSEKCLAQLRQLQHTEASCRFKMTRGRMTDICIHTGSDSSRLLLAAADTRGQLALAAGNLQALQDYGKPDWHGTAPKHETHPVSVTRYRPHNQVVTHVQCRGHSVLTSSNDQTLRALHIDRAVIDEVYRADQEVRFFAAVPNSDAELVLGLKMATIVQLDTRQPADQSSEHKLSGYRDLIRTVDVHPTQPHLVAVAMSSKQLCVYDRRALKKTTTDEQKPVYKISVRGDCLSAFFSPVTGSRIVAAYHSGNFEKQKDEILIYDVSGATQECIANVRHNNHTGRFLTKFRPNWLPANETLVISGAKEQLRTVDIIDAGENGIVEQLSGNSAVASVVAVHPHIPVVAGSNAAGYAYLWI